MKWMKELETSVMNTILNVESNLLKTVENVERGQELNDASGPIFHFQF